MSRSCADAIAFGTEVAACRRAARTSPSRSSRQTASRRDYQFKRQQYEQVRSPRILDYRRRQEDRDVPPVWIGRANTARSRYRAGGVLPSRVIEGLLAPDRVALEGHPRPEQTAETLSAVDRHLGVRNRHDSSTPLTSRRAPGVSRRSFLADTGMGFTGLALGAMLFRDGVARADAECAARRSAAPAAKAKCGHLDLPLRRRQPRRELRPQAGPEQVRRQDASTRRPTRTSSIPSGSRTSSPATRRTAAARC